MKALHLSTKLKTLFLSALVLAGFSPIRAGIKPEAQVLARAIAATLESAQTVQLSAKHKWHASLSVGSPLDQGPISITFKRPNLFYAVQEAKEATREISYDGKTICIMHPALKHHALEPLKVATVEQFADLMDSRFGFRPPVAELLANDLEAQILSNVTEASIASREWVGWTRCDRLRLVQAGMTADLWVGVKDKLPRRMLLTYTDTKGHPTWEIRLSQWQLNPQVDAALFSKRPASDSTQVKLLKAR
jgi:hypothetical protein